MNVKQIQRSKFLIGLMVLSIITMALILYVLKQNINLFYTPTQLVELPLDPTQTLRVGGFVKAKSVVYDTSGSNVRFIITDHAQDILVTFQGILPNLFHEGQTVVVTGHLTSAHYLLASDVLAKHDEYYRPSALS